MAWRLLLCGIFLGCIGAGQARADSLFPSRQREPAQQTPHVALDNLSPNMREKIRTVMENAAFRSKGPLETFNCHHHVYRWLLDHPDFTVKLWRQAGAQVAEIEGLAGVYHYRDDQGTEIFWQTATRSAGQHVWFAEGKVKPGALLPLTPFRAVVIMQYTEGLDPQAKSAVQHQVHFLVHCDSKAMSLLLRLLGASAPKMAEQYLGQLQMFYGGMSWYLYQDEDRARTMYRKVGLLVEDKTTEKPR